MISAHLMGGLGNQLFQIFATIAYALRYNRPFVFEQRKSTANDRQKMYWDNILYFIRKNTTPNRIQWSIYRESGYLYKPISLVKCPMKLYGYFQSYKYFIDQYKTIIKILQLRKKQNAVKERNEKYFQENNVNISLHFRIGDYVLPQFRDTHPLMPIVYYKKAIIKIIEKTKIDKLNIIYFCEKKDNERVENIYIAVLQRKFPNITFVKASDELDDWEQMLLMSCCDHHIIANSSFSWWGAYFNASREKIVCYPSVWFNPKVKNHDTRYLCPDSWHKIGFV